jgi:hypothetical protein
MRSVYFHRVVRLRRIAGIFFFGMVACWPAGPTKIGNENELKLENENDLVDPCTV